MKTIIDVSEFNGAINWQRVAPQIDGAILRVGYRGYGSYGTLTLDKRFQENLRGVIAAGIPWGVYFLTQAVSDAEAEAEARFVDGALRGELPELGVWLDSEYGEAQNGTGRADGLKRFDRTRYALTFLRTLRGMGYDTGLYCAASWFNGYLYGENIRADGHGIWLASVEHVEPAIEWDGWQYTWKGRIDGIAGDVDISRFREEGDYMGKYYADTEGHWAEQHIDRMRDEGLMNGKTATEFAPNDPITRAEVATVLSRLLDKLR